MQVLCKFRESFVTDNIRTLPVFEQLANKFGVHSGIRRIYIGCSVAQKWTFSGEEKLVAPLIAAPNVDKAIEDK
jgi:hypothetical protein